MNPFKMTGKSLIGCSVSASVTRKSNLKKSQTPRLKKRHLRNSRIGCRIFNAPHPRRPPPLALRKKTIG
jgi:hypothetical protein